MALPPSPLGRTVAPASAVAVAIMLVVTVSTEASALRPLVAGGPNDDTASAAPHPHSPRRRWRHGPSPPNDPDSGVREWRGGDVAGVDRRWVSECVAVVGDVDQADRWGHCWSRPAAAIEGVVECGVEVARPRQVEEGRAPGGERRERGRRLGRGVEEAAGLRGEGP